MKKNHIPLLAAGIAVIVILAAVLIGVTAGSSGHALTKQLSLGERYLAEFDYESAILAYGKAIEIDPNSADAYLGLAKALLALGRTGEAVQILAEGYAATGDARLAAMLGELEPTGEGGEASIPEAPDTGADTDDTPPYIIIPGDAPDGGTVLNGGALTFKDPALEKALREFIGKPEGELTIGDFEKYNQIFLDSKGITDLSGLEALAALPNLTVISLSGNEITDLSPLAGFEQLTILQLDSNRITDLGPLKNLTNLTFLLLDNNRISDLTPLAGMTRLTDLQMMENDITDLSGLAGLTSLKFLQLGSNAVTDLSPLASLTGLETLMLIGNRISDLSPLAHLTNLKSLGLDANPITDFSPVAHVANVSGRR